MDVYRHLLTFDSLSLLFIFFTAFSAATLTPAVHRFLPWVVQALIWIGFLGVSILRVDAVSDPRVREATSAVVWAASRLLYMQAGALQAAVQGWLVANRSTVATLTLVLAAADAFALMLIRSHRRARRSAPRVHLGEWFVLPRPAVAPAPDAVVELDRRLAAMARTRLQSLAHSTPAREVFVKPFAHVATHVLGPGPARLRMVKLAIGLEEHHQEPGLATQPNLDESRQPATAASRTRPAVRVHHKRSWPRWRRANVLRIDRAVNASSDEGAKAGTKQSVAPGPGKDGVAAQTAVRLAS